MERAQIEQFLSIELTQEELLEHGAEAAEAKEKISSVEADHKVAKEEYKDELSFLESNLKRHLKAIKAGSEDRPVPCTWEFDSPETGSKSLVRLDNGETVRVEVMEGDDLQPSLPLDDMPEVMQ